MIVQVRTRCDLITVLRMGLTAAWVVTLDSLRRNDTTRVHVVSFDGSLRIEGDYCEVRSVENHPDHPAGRTVIAFTDGRIVLCNVDFFGSQNPVAYHDLSYEQETRAEPTYAPIDGQWPSC